MFQSAETNQHLFTEQLENVIEFGFRLGGQQFKYLAASPSSYKKLSGWFVNENLYKKGIYKELGEFKPEKLAKMLARIGQYFSTSKRIMDIPID